MKSTFAAALALAFLSAPAAAAATPPPHADASLHATRDATAYRRYLEQCHAAHVCNGVYLVARHGKPVFVTAIGDDGGGEHAPLSVDSAFDIGSIAKQFTAMAVLRLETEGRLATSDRVSTFLADFPYPQVTIAQLLSHTSGVPDLMADYSKLLQAGQLQDPVIGKHAAKDLAVKDAPPEFPPGSRFEYSNSGYLVLAQLVETVAQRPFDEYLQTTFFTPLGMHNTSLRMPATDALIASRAWGFKPLPDGTQKAYDQFPGLYLRGGGGIYSTAGDLLRWQTALLSGSAVPMPLWTRATTPVRLSDGTTSPYGFGLSLKPDGRGQSRISHGGHWRAFKSDLSYFPQADLTVIQLTNNAEDDSVDRNVTALETIASGKTPEPVLTRIGPELHSRLDKTPAQVRSWFDSALAGNPRRYEIDEQTFNALGYSLLNRKELDKAVLVFQLGSIAFPTSANMHDSIADVYEAQGKTSEARKCVQAAVDLDPTSIKLRERRDALNRRLAKENSDQATPPE